MVSLEVLVVALVLVLALLWGSYVIRQLRQQLQQQRQQLKSLQGDLRSLCGSSVQMGERFSRMVRQIDQLSVGHKQLHEKQQDQRSPADSEELAYEQAVKLAQKGATPEELIDICNITRGEAEIITMMQRLEGAPSNVYPDQQQ